MNGKMSRYKIPSMCLTKCFPPKKNQTVDLLSAQRNKTVNTRLIITSYDMVLRRDIESAFYTSYKLSQEINQSAESTSLT